MFNIVTIRSTQLVSKVDYGYMLYPLSPEVADRPKLVDGLYIYRIVTESEESLIINQVFSLFDKDLTEINIEHSKKLPLRRADAILKGKVKKS